MWKVAGRSLNSQVVGLVFFQLVASIGCAVPFSSTSVSMSYMADQVNTLGVPKPLYGLPRAGGRPQLPTRRVRSCS